MKEMGLFGKKRNAKVKSCDAQLRLNDDG